MLRSVYYSFRRLKKKNAEICIGWAHRAVRNYSSIPEFTEIRYSYLKRGSYNKLSTAHIEYFQSLLGYSRVLLDTSDVEPYNIDFPKHARGRSEVVLKPKTTEEVSMLLKFCNDNNLAVCPQGGNSGLVGGSVPVFDEIIISLALMNKIIDLDEFSGALTCEAGCILEALDNYLQEFDLMMPLDLGAKGICQIGGNISTNAGGIRLFRYGNLHGSVMGLEVVLANGQIIDLMSTMKKDNTGYHLKNLFIGAEGTLGIITKAVIQCPPLPRSINVAFLGINKFNNILEAFRKARLYLGEILSACEMMDDICFEKCIAAFNIKDPLSEKYKFYVLFETRTGLGGNDFDKLSQFVEEMLEKEIANDAFVTNEPQKVKNIWEIREKASLAVYNMGYAYKYDISLPLKNFYKPVEIMREKLKNTNVTAVIGFGHLGDGNLHLNICSEEFDPEIKKLIEPYVFEVTQELKGSISAEHGIGLEKPQFLHFSKSSASIQLMKQVKQLFDPKAILNPYKVLPP